MLDLEWWGDFEFSFDEVTPIPDAMHALCTGCTQNFAQAQTPANARREHFKAKNVFYVRCLVIIPESTVNCSQGEGGF